MRGSANFDPKAWDRVRARVVRDIPDLSLSEAGRLLAAAGADRPKALNRVDGYLAATVDGVLAPDASCPLAIVRLTHLLIAEGHTSVTPPSCTQCQRRVQLAEMGPTGRICGRCGRLEATLHVHAVRKVLGELASHAPGRAGVFELLQPGSIVPQGVP
jgi:hypothetical protein